MTAYALIGHMGPADQPVQIAGRWQAQFPVDLLSGNRTLGYGIGLVVRSLGKLDVYPSEVGIDVLVLAAMVHAADTRINREETSQDAWTRELADSDEAAPLIRFDRAPGFRDDLAPGPRLCWRIFVIPSRVVSSFPGLLSSQTVSDKVDAMRVMHEAVEDRVGVSWIANDLVPG